MVLRTPGALRRRNVLDSPSCSSNSRTTADNHSNDDSAVNNDSRNSKSLRYLPFARKRAVGIGDIFTGRWWTQNYDRVATYLLMLSLTLWLVAILWSPEQESLESGQPSRINVPLRERTRLRTQARGHIPPPVLPLQKPSPLEHLWHDATDGLSALVHTSTPPVPAKKSRKKGNREAIPPTCYRPEWQTYHFPSCNDVHDIRLVDNLLHKRGKLGDARLALIADGLWRDVWTVAPRSPMKEPIVMKIMKMEHEVDSRNFDRHRRDALTMERLTSSPNIVDIFGFCGNTMLTEYIPVTLSDLIFRPTPVSEEDQINLALEVFRGLQALHDVPGGPIVHADIDAKQFLVQKHYIKLNDFNRCRFMARHNATDDPCTFQIPTSPGRMRAPEEYLDQDLDEKIDVYSAGNILYTILTGKEPWADYTTSELKDFVKRGVMPAVPEEYRPVGSHSEQMANLTYRVFTHDRKKRPSASDVVAELMRLKEQHKLESK
jgi:hypothetical protein